MPCGIEDFKIFKLAERLEMNYGVPPPFLKGEERRG
jgi:hypothetical protein